MHDGGVGEQVDVNLPGEGGRVVIVPRDAGVGAGVGDEAADGPGGAFGLLLERGVVNMNVVDCCRVEKNLACRLRCCAKRWRLSGPPESSCGGWLQTARICIG